MTTLRLLALIGAALLIASAYYGLRFYPPGWGYDEEKRNNRIALVLLIVGCLFLFSPLFLQGHQS